ncbi:MAG: hypothetical protein LBG77_07135 [Dysgonamonadaceae bacterium]|jgi:hypothetical protein|nr:hypothetical protein [Dysgonamonadaceae bacterium]
MKTTSLSILLILSLSFASCKSRQPEPSAPSPFKPVSAEPLPKPAGNRPAQAGQPTLVYKTTADFYNNVPILMNRERSEIVSYPDPADLSYQAKPTLLKNGYLLDNRGINENVVFLNYTYETYSRLPEAPSLQELKANILSKYPLTELIDCGNRYQYKNIEEEINRLIDNGFAGCRVIYSAPAATVGIPE